MALGAEQKLLIIFQVRPHLMEEEKRSSAKRWKKVKYIRRYMRQADKLLLFTFICMMLPSVAGLGAAGSPAAAPTTATISSASPSTGAAPPPTTSTQSPPKSESAPPPKSASPPASTIPAPKPAPAATPPATASTPPPTAKPAATAPKSAANLTSPPPVVATPPPKAVAKLAPSPPPSSPPAPAPAPSPASAPPDLDISQLAALRALQVNINPSHPCKTSEDILLCDNSAPPRHLTSLSLKDCPRATNFSTQALFNLSTLQNLELVNCSVEPVHVPQILVKSLKTFICTASLGKTGTNEKAAKLSGVWLSTLTNLDELSVTDVEVSVSGLTVIVQEMKGLTQLMMPRVNMPGVLPKRTWPAGLEYIDLSGNSIRGTLPSQMRSLTQLKHLDLSDNQIKGVVPNIFGDLTQLQYLDLGGNQFSGRIPGSLASLRNCSRLDLSNNKLNGTIPANLTSIRTLRYLDLSQNELTGPIPFNSTFLNKLTTLKLTNNPGLCYNHTALKSKFLTGIRNCVSLSDDSAAFAPAPAPGSSKLDTSSSKSGGVSKGAAAGISVVVIVAAAAVVFVVRKWWKSRDEADEFVNLRAQNDRP